MWSNHLATWGYSQKKGKYRRHWEVNDFLTEMIFNQKVKSAAGQLKTVVTSSNSEINF